MNIGVGNILYESGAFSENKIWENVESLDLNFEGIQWEQTVQSVPDDSTYNNEHNIGSMAQGLLTCQGIQGCAVQMGYFFTKKIIFITDTYTVAF